MRARQAPARGDVAEEDGGERVAASPCLGYHASEGAPALARATPGHDSAPAHQHDDRPRIRGGDGLDQPLVRWTESERGAGRRRREKKRYSPSSRNV